MSQIDQLLQAAADAFDPPAPPDLARFTSAARRRQATQRTAGAALAVVALVSSVTVAVRWRNEMTTTAPTAHATVEDLVTYRWSNLPTAPIDVRAQAALAWTGKEMVVWGGVTHAGTILGDGAAFDPARSTWRRIATPTDLSPRYGATALWTGTELLVLGGQRGPDAVFRDRGTAAGAGAAYDPAADRWRPLPAGPADTEPLLAAVWTGDEAVTLTSGRSTAAYDPSTNRWRSLSPLPEPAENELMSVVPVWTGTQLLAWGLWAHNESPPDTNTQILGSGIDLFSLDVATGEWTARPHDRLVGVSSAFWTGHDVAVPAPAGVWRGSATGPGFVENLHGLRYDPGNDTYTAMAHGPLDDGSPESYWTGAAVFIVGHASVQGAGQDIDDRDTAAWDPLTDHWTRLDRAPAGVTYETPLLWTGREFLTYGAQPTRFGR